MYKKISITLNRVKGDTKQIRANVFANGKMFTIPLSVVSSGVYINPMKVYRAYKQAYPRSVIKMHNPMFGRIVRAIATDWGKHFRYVSIHH
ncbi:MAG: hypothetical protein J0M11_20775 [Anaerolineae bacterium]|nr:hypothetical protein [Anaerolineae bacterium]